MNISVITPIKNRPEFHPIMERIIESQTHSPFEWWIIEEEESYNAHKRPIRGANYILVPDSTVGEKLNLAFSKCTGDFITLFSSDDFYAPDYLATMNRLATNKKAISSSSLFLYKLQERKYGKLMTKNSYSAVFGYNSDITQKWNIVKRRGEDRVFITELSNRLGDRYLFTDEFLDKFLIINHGGNISTNDNVQELDEDYQFLKKFVKDKDILDFYCGYRKDNT